MAPKTGRHYVGNFELDDTKPASAAPSGATPKPVPEKIVISQPKPAPNPPARPPVRHAARRSGSSVRTLPAQLDLSPLPRDDLYVSPDDRLTGLQRAQLTALDEAEKDIRPDLMLEAKNVVRGNLKRVVITPNAMERLIFERIGVPGF